MKSNSFAPGSKGHDIIDEVAVKNKSRNLQTFIMCENMPSYFGQTNIGEEKVTLKPIRRKEKLGKQLLISDVVEGTKNLVLKDTQPSITLVDPDTGERKRVSVNPNLIKFIKTCVACSYNVNSDLSDVLTFFVHEVTGHCDNLILPIDYPSANKTQKVFAKELNDFLKEFCDDKGIEYGEIVSTSKRRSKKAVSMIDTLKQLGGK